MTKDDRRIMENLARHGELMAAMIDRGFARDEASSLALKQMRCSHPFEERQIYIYQGSVQCGICRAITGKAGFHE